MPSSGATWYYHATYIAFSYFELFTDYEDDIFKVISNLHIQLEMWGSKFGGNIYIFWGKSLKSWSGYWLRYEKDFVQNKLCLVTFLMYIMNDIFHGKSVLCLICTLLAHFKQGHWAKEWFGSVASGAIMNSMT